MAQKQGKEETVGSQCSMLHITDLQCGSIHVTHYISAYTVTWTMTTLDISDMKPGLH